MARIGFDLDGTLVDWDEGHDRALDGYGERAARILRSNARTRFDLFGGLSDEEAEIMREVMNAMSYRALKPYPGAVDAVHRVAAAGHDVRIVSSPWVSNPTCASDKIAWVREELGYQFGAKIVLTADKTLVKLNLLVDDKGHINGAEEFPEWEHIVYDAPHNRDSDARYRLSGWESSSVDALLALARVADSHKRESLNFMG